MIIIHERRFLAKGGSWTKSETVIDENALTIEIEKTLMQLITDIKSSDQLTTVRLKAVRFVTILLIC